MIGAFNSSRRRGSVRATSAAGFTLLEVVVAVGIFSVVLLIVISSFTRFVAVQRRDIDEQAFQEDIRLALDLMNREALTAFGDTYQTAVEVGIDGVGSTPDDEPSLYLRNQEGDCVRFFVREGQLFRNSHDSAGDCIDPAQYTQSERALTGKDSTIVQTHFEVNPSLVNGTQLTSKGYVTISLEARASAKNDVLHLQSTVTSRQYNPY